MINLRAKEAEHAAQMFAKSKGLDEGSDKFFQSNEFTPNSNKEVVINPNKNAPVSKQVQEVAKVETGWGEDDDDL